MPKIKYPTNYLRERRKSLGLTQVEVAKAIGVEEWAYMKLEQRGELPEMHFERLSAVLRVSIIDLSIEKYAPVVREVFHIPTHTFRLWIKANIGTDKAFGHKTARLIKRQIADSDLPESHRKVLEYVKNLTPEEGFKELIKSGIYTPDGKLAPEYGGPKKKVSHIT